MSFKNTIIILTSNLGSSYILEMGQKDPDSVKDMVMSIVRAVPLCLPALVPARWCLHLIRPCTSRRSPQRLRGGPAGLEA